VVGVVVRRARGSAAAGVVVAMLAALVVAQVVGVRPAHADVGTSLGITTLFRNILVDPASGRVLVSGDDEVAVLAPDGSMIATIPGVPGAGPMDVDGAGHLWVAETSADALAEIDLTSLQVVRTAAMGVSVDPGGLVDVQGALWFVSGGFLQRFDPVTGTRASKHSALSPNLAKIDATTSKVIGWDSGSPGSLRVVDLSTAPPTWGPSWSAASDTHELAVDPADGLVVSGGTLGAPESSLAGDQRDGVTYAPAGGAAVAYAAGSGGIVAGTTGSTVVAWSVGRPVPAAQASLAHGVVQGGLALSLDGTAAYAVTMDSSPNPNGLHLEVAHFATQVSSAVPTTVVSGVPTTITVHGTDIGGATSVQIGGHAAGFSTTSASELAVTPPPSLSPGATQLTVTTPFGTASTPITVQANTGATLHGTVSGPSGPLTGASLTLTGPSLSSPRTATTAADGTYTFNSLPAATDDVLVAHDSTGADPDQTAAGIAVTPNGTTTQDITFAASGTGPPADLAAVDLGMGTPRDLLVDPTTDRTFVSGDDEVEVYDHDGHLLAAVHGIYGAAAETLGPDGVYVDAASVSRIVRIDRSSLSVTGSWATARPTDGALAYAGGRVWFTNGDSQWVDISSLDPATGMIVDSNQVRYAPRLQSIEGSTNRFYAWEGDTSFTGFVYDASGAMPSLLKTAPNTGAGTASVSLDRLWSVVGGEYQLSTFTQTGLHYPFGSFDKGGAVLSPFVSFSPARGGVLAFGTDIDRVGTTTVANALPDTPALEDFDSGADRVVYVASGQLHVWDLHPHLQSVVPPQVGDTWVSLNAQGLQTLTSITLDGTTLSASPPSTPIATLATPPLTAGFHTISATTAWGSSNTLTFLVGDQPAPQVTAISPVGGPTTGGTPVTITGHGFLLATGVTFGGSAATFQVVDDTTITGTAPAHAAGSAAVTVTTAGGSGSGTSYRYVAGGSPHGSLDVVIGGSQQVRARGWALDPDTLAASSVRLTVDGGSFGTWPANASRPDVGAAFPGFGDDHGFDISAPVIPGFHQVCAIAVNTGIGSDVALGCRTVNVGTGSPVGNIDRVGTTGPTTITVSGWDLDPDTTAPIPVDVYVDGHGARYTAGGSRPDLAVAFPGQGTNHGFDLAIPTTPGTHNVCAYAINTGPGTNALLGCRSVTMPTGSPQGAADAIVGGHGQVTVRGWALDPDTAASIPVAVYVGSAGAWYTANGTRADIAAAFPGYGPAHGYTQTIAAAAGTANVCVFAINQGPGANALLRCQAVTIT
jgi:hypothetical protein